MTWNIADLWEVVAEEAPTAPCLTHGARRLTWGEVDRRANGLAASLLELGLGEQDKVAQYLYNCPEYGESVFATFKAGLVPVNTNYRYREDELAYLWDNADCAAVVFHGSFSSLVERVRGRVSSVRAWVWVDDGSSPCPAWALPYEALVGSRAERVLGPWGRSGDQLLIIYTGGTTGRPKGVMWRQDDFVVNLLGGVLGDQLGDGPEDRRSALTTSGPVGLPACPLMHGTGFCSQFVTLALGGSSVTLPSRNLDVDELLDTIERERVSSLTIVGDVFARPMVDRLDAQPERWDLSSLEIVISSGAMWSAPVKDALLVHRPNLMLIDTFSSSEALGMGQSVSSGGTRAGTGEFRSGGSTMVVDDAGRPVQPGSGEIGRVAVGGRIPVGYYKDPVGSAATFVELDGRRYSCPGDYARIEADGTLTLLGRGSGCINTGGEKVYPEEVEEVLKTSPAVRDAVVVGVPDARFGEAVTALVELDDGQVLAPEDLIALVKDRLASYKAPKQVIAMETIGRAPNGKVDHPRLRAFAIEAVGS